MPNYCPECNTALNVGATKCSCGWKVAGFGGKQRITQCHKCGGPYEVADLRETASNSPARKLVPYDPPRGLCWPCYDARKVSP